MYFNETTKHVEVRGIKGLNDKCSLSWGKTNIYNPKKKQWKNFALAVKRLNDFNNCSLVFCILRAPERPLDDNDEFVIFFKSIFSAIGSKLNFRFDFKDDVFEKKDNDVFLYIGDLLKSNAYQIFVIVSDAYVLAHNTGEPYGEFEKLILPFDFPTWILIWLFFGSGILLIILIKTKLSEEQQKFVFGSRVKTPIFNMMVSFFGQSHNILPGRNFARYHLMIFILFCLVIRTGYQGVQFELMLTVSFEFYLIFFNYLIVK